MSNRTLKISFDGVSPAEALMFSQDLEQRLREGAPAVQIEREKTNPSQDFGATLVLLFGTPVAIALAKAVSNYLARNSGASITITESGEVIGKNLDSKDAARIAEAFGRKSR